MDEESVVFRASPGGVATVTLHRPEVHNAFDAEVVERLGDILEDIAVADGIRVVLIEAVGKSFCAGADLNWMRDAIEILTEEDNREDARALGEVLRRLYTLPKPTVALVQGPAYGGGVGLVAACDYVVAVKHATFSLTEVKLGLVPAVIAPYVVAAIGPRQARRYMLTAERFNAVEAQRIGLVHRVVDDAAELPGIAETIVSQLFEGAPQAVAETKELVARVAGRPVDRNLIDEMARVLAEVRAREEGREGVTAFLDKRRPRWLS